MKNGAKSQRLKERRILEKKGQGLKKMLTQKEAEKKTSKMQREVKRKAGE